VPEIGDIPPLASAPMATMMPATESFSRVRIPRMIDMVASVVGKRLLAEET